MSERKSRGRNSFGNVRSFQIQKLSPISSSFPDSFNINKKIFDLSDSVCKNENSPIEEFHEIKHCQQESRLIKSFDTPQKQKYKIDMLSSPEIPEESISSAETRTTETSRKRKSRCGKLSSRKRLYLGKDINRISSVNSTGDVKEKSFTTPLWNLISIESASKGENSVASDKNENPDSKNCKTFRKSLKTYVEDVGLKDEIRSNFQIESEDVGKNISNFDVVNNEKDLIYSLSEEVNKVKIESFESPKRHSVSICNNKEEIINTFKSVINQPLNSSLNENTNILGTKKPNKHNFSGMYLTEITSRAQSFQSELKKIDVNTNKFNNSSFVKNSLILSENWKNSNEKNQQRISFELSFAEQFHDFTQENFDIKKSDLAEGFVSPSKSVDKTVRIAQVKTPVKDSSSDDNIIQSSPDVDKNKKKRFSKQKLVYRSCQMKLEETIKVSDDGTQKVSRSPLNNKIIENECSQFKEEESSFNIFSESFNHWFIPASQIMDLPIPRIKNDSETADGIKNNHKLEIVDCDSRSNSSHLITSPFTTPTKLNLQHIQSVESPIKSENEQEDYIFCSPQPPLKSRGENNFSSNSEIILGNQNISPVQTSPQIRLNEFILHDEDANFDTFETTFPTNKNIKINEIQAFKTPNKKQHLTIENINSPRNKSKLEPEQLIDNNSFSEICYRQTETEHFVCQGSKNEVNSCEISLDKYKTKKKAKSGTLLEKAFSIATRIDTDFTLFEYELKNGLRPTSNKYVSSLLKIEKTSQENNLLFIYCKPFNLFISNEYSKSHQLIVVANNVQSTKINSEFIYIHFPVTVIFNPELNTTFILAGNQLQLNDGNTSFHQNKTKNTNLIKIHNLKFDTGYSSLRIMCSLQSNLPNSILELVAGQIIFPEMILDLQIINRFITPDKILHLLLEDKERQFCLINFDEERDVERMNCLVREKKLKEGFIVKLKGFYIREKIILDKYIYSLLEYCDIQNNEDSHIYVMEAYIDNWSIDHIIIKK